MSGVTGMVTPPMWIRSTSPNGPPVMVTVVPPVSGPEVGASEAAVTASGR